MQVCIECESHSFLLEKKLLSKENLKKAIKQFKGLEGRLDLKSNKTIIPVYESYGSSYAKAKADLNALSMHFPNKKIIAVFEPHTFSWRNENAKIYNHQTCIPNNNPGKIIISFVENAKNSIVFVLFQ